MRPRDPEDVVYLVNLALGLTALIWLIVRTSRRWHEYPSEIKMLLTATTALLFALIITSGERFLLHLPLTFDTLVISVTKLFVLFTLYQTTGTRYRTGTRNKQYPHREQKCDNASVDAAPNDVYSPPKPSGDQPRSDR